MIRDMDSESYDLSVRWKTVKLIAEKCQDSRCSLSYNSPSKASSHVYRLTSTTGASLEGLEPASLLLTADQFALSSVSRPLR